MQHMVFQGYDMDTKPYTFGMKCTYFMTRKFDNV